MRINDREIAELSNGDADLEGILLYKKSGAGNRQQLAFKERWFKLRYNILFYYNIAEDRKGKKQLAGAMILEQCVATPVPGSPMLFSLKFEDEQDKEYLFSGSAEDYVIHWVTAINRAGYERWRTKLIQLQNELISLTGEDPLLKFGYNGGRGSLTENSNDSPGPRKKSVGKASFRSYVKSSTPAPANAPTAASSVDLGLQFHDDHFGNGLVAIGEPAKLRIGEIQRHLVPDLQNLVLSGAGETAPCSVARARPRPVRKAPDPPSRPPRGMKTVPPHPPPASDSSNLIEF